MPQPFISELSQSLSDAVEVEVEKLERYINNITKASDGNKFVEMTNKIL